MLEAGSRDFNQIYSYSGAHRNEVTERLESDWNNEKDHLEIFHRPQD